MSLFGKSHLRVFSITLKKKNISKIINLKKFIFISKIKNIINKIFHLIFQIEKNPVLDI